ncbi:MAG TPA: isocitrate lyase/phosphoenolpyruvate mutase family protein [Dongiaceae bacterium]|nr:isocitrate lyase/phosphoenolpyruvate mutase family protein [Dongiaceae bacterium]
MTARAETAAIFHRLHEGPDPLLLPNAWDAGSARLMESLGAKAVATTSAGVAWTHGYPDGDALPVRLLVSTVATIARAIRVPLTVDVEGGYSDDPAAVEETVAKVVEAGAAGINIEDGSNAPDLLCLKIERAKRAGQHFGIDLFVNARTDVYLRGLAPEDKRVTETLSRAQLYRDAGASGIFVPGLRDPGEIRPVAAGAGLPLNVMAWPGLPAADELSRLGVRRLSAGSGISQAVWGKAAALATDFLKSGKSEPLGEGAMPYPAINALFAPR